MNQVVIDFYRCPESFISFTLADEISPESGYFCFGRDALCYGQSTLAAPTKVLGNGLADLSQDVAPDGPTLRLPFDPSKTVDNLRRERYPVHPCAGNTILSSEVIRKLYYCFRPLLPVPVRKRIQRLSLRNWSGLPFPAWPVDTTVERISKRLLLLAMKAQDIERTPFVWFWPEGASSCVMVTHDVETKAGVAFGPSLMDVDEASGFQASFQVIPENRYPVSKNFLAALRDRGFEVNVQDLNHDGNLFSNREEFQRRALLINRYLQEYGALGFRSGALYRNSDWYDALDISYDMSVPNVAHLDPQRGGCCTVFPYFIGRILELPLTTIQDYSLLYILGDYSIQLWKEQIALITKEHGLVSFIVHPDYIQEGRALGVYKTLLCYLSHLRDEKNVWVALPRDVNRWWRERSQMKLVFEGGRWRIDGPGYKRARIAYASVEDGQMVYKVSTGDSDLMPGHSHHCAA
jgi:hypothetical protein